MIITRTPFRVSFAGGGSDLPSFYTRHDGCVLSTSINKYMYVTIHPSFNRHETIVKYSKTEIAAHPSQIAHPIARQLLMDYGVSGVEITSTADIPSGTGLSTSSAYTVGLINALNAFVGKYAAQEKIAQRACHLEIEELGEPIGKQDQYGTAVGGLKLIRFFSDGTVDVEPVLLLPEVQRQMNENLMLFYTGFTHAASAILKKQNRNTLHDQDKFLSLIRMTQQAYELRDALIAGNLHRLGELLDEGWNMKRCLADGITRPEIDHCYAVAKENGALGGKILGAGGGGFLLLYCEQDKQEQVRKALSPMVELPFHMEHGGTKIIYVGEKDWE